MALSIPSLCNQTLVVLQLSHGQGRASSLIARAKQSTCALLLNVLNRVQPMKWSGPFWQKLQNKSLFGKRVQFPMHSAVGNLYIAL